MESFLGYLAAFCTTAAFIPQALKVYKSNHTKDISVAMFSLMTFGIILWLIYGIIIVSYPIIIANLLTVFFAVYILLMKIKIDVIKTEPHNKS